MSCFTRAGSVAAGVLILWIWSALPAWADPLADQNNPPVMVAVQIPTVPTNGGPTTITIQLSPAPAGRPTELRVTSDALTAAPVVISTSMGPRAVSNVQVDAQHTFDWKVSSAPTASGCGPHPVASTPECGAPAALVPTQKPSPVTTDQSQASQPPAAQNLTRPQAPAVSTTPSIVTYTVQRGDTLHAIARRFYGDPAGFAAIDQANSGRVMSDGAIFDDPSSIRPGWQLDIPQPTQRVEERSDGRWYTVQAGDTLSGIAATLLGDAGRWSELYAMNQASVGGPLSNNPNLIQPGMQLHLPWTASDSSPLQTASSAMATDAGGLAQWPG
jgi:nucleoid-associated protein YgaU